MSRVIRDLYSPLRLFNYNALIKWRGLCHCNDALVQSQLSSFQMPQNKELFTVSNHHSFLCVRVKQYV